MNASFQSQAQKLRVSFDIGDYWNDIIGAKKFGPSWISTKDKARTVRGLIGTAVDMGVQRICLQLSEDVPIFLVFRDVTSNASENGLVEFFVLAMCL